jgi:hypothetical protein
MFFCSGTPRCSIHKIANPSSSAGTNDRILIVDDHEPPVIHASNGLSVRTVDRFLQLWQRREKTLDGPRANIR